MSYKYNNSSTATEPLIAAGTMQSDDHQHHHHTQRINTTKNYNNALFHQDQYRSYSFRQFPEQGWIFDELPLADVVSVSKPETGDISPMLLSYTIELQYKQFKWRIQKKASQVLYLHFALKRRILMEELHEKQEQVKEWLHSLGIGDHVAVVQDVDDPDDGALPIHQEESVRNRNVPSMAAFPIIRPALGGQQSISDQAKVAMQNYLNHFLGNLDIVNSREVCKFLEVSKMSFLREYGSKLKEGYIMVKHLPKIRVDDKGKCCPCSLLDIFNNNWQKVWAVLKPGFLALLEDPFDTKLLDIIIFDVLPYSDQNGESQGYLASQIKERNPLRYTFKVSSGNRSIRIRTTSSGKVKQWVGAINDAGVRPLEGWCHPHRFGSFAPPRGVTEDGSQAQWFIDGHAAFEAIASAIEDAKSELFITGWWLCPELYLRRPFQDHAASRLDALLKAKAKQGVQIYILLYKEVSIALKINSLYSKKRLLNIHENVKVLRHPDHFSTGIYLWSHHEKLVIVDHQICFIGGLDLCFGRYDTIEHRVGDCPPDIWPGKDYYNPRESEPNSWEDTMKDELDRGKYPRMPWHDVHCALWGPPCRDVARHFVQRWNHAKRSKAPNEETIPLLMPHHHMVLPHYMGRSREIDIEGKNPEENQKDITRQDSFSSLTPLQDIPLLLPQDSDSVVSYSEEQRLTKEGINGNHNQPTGDHGNFPFSFQNSEGEAVAPSTPEEAFLEGFNSLEPQSKLHISDECSEPSEEGNNDVSDSEYQQVGPRSACHCQVIRSVSQWSSGASQPEDSIHNAYCSLIEKAQNFIYIENQFFISGLSGDEVIQNRVLDALYKRILLADKEGKTFRVIVVMPLLPGFQGGLDDGGAATVRAIMHWQYRTISWEKTSILYNLKALLGPKAHDYISFYGLRTYGRLFQDGPLATSQVYVHSKVMIVDDRIALIGSSNINDRSLLGSRDSEIGVVIEDKEFVDSSMNGEPWKAGKFAFSLRCSLWSEHLGLHAGEISKISDPVAETTYRDLWLATAKENTKIYQEVFACIPNEIIHSRSALRQSMNHWKEKLGHTTIDLGIAPNKLEYNDNGETKVMDPMEKLKSVKGHLVSFPLQFMCHEDLRPMFSEGEFYASPQVFH
ncbi:Phospholipase D zeta 1 [Turnera subulata]|uniref:Phospholipase n=1 Tax=Turnera subulata TaxID=218843 RepID=A0A9Q0FPI8_9ROSI|nr:Phospholipase D zeta 1 [Turnera subulata]